jgi:hypothetical protein
MSTMDGGDLSSNVLTCMQYILIFGHFTSVGVETKYGQKQPIWTWRLFSKFRQKITGFEIWKGFGGDLEHPNIWIV